MLPEHEVAQPSPVHAGIDRQLVAASRSRLRFPRTRGDRPHPARHHLKSFWGSPARAGIDLGIASSLLRGQRFPRTRGDRPIAGHFCDITRLVPPHARG